ncbi:hypothetical protein, partial [Prevotella pallens]|uniref:hypothetical protein n=1 Tax=Prevotella pallens TaxID=60133 RepID=UPI003C797D4A
CPLLKHVRFSAYQMSITPAKTKNITKGIKRKGMPNVCKAYLILLIIKNKRIKFVIFSLRFCYRSTAIQLLFKLNAIGTAKAIG